MKCEKCGKLLVKVDRREEMADFDEDATDGQMADYFAAEESGDHGAWNIAIVEYECRRCHIVYQIQGEDLNSYEELILSWHSKAGDAGDPFSNFVFEYLAFIAHLKNNLYYETERDRDAIQWLKKNTERRDWYMEEITSNVHLKKIWESILRELTEQPLRNSSQDLDNPEVDKWWNSPGSVPDVQSAKPRGVIHSMSDWPNMVEFWCGVRNNLFHGGKNPTFVRDRFLVEHAFITLRAFMDLELRKYCSK